MPSSNAVASSQNSGILVKGVTKTYGNQPALQGVNLTINRGDFLALFGPNGAGKSTLLSILCGLIRPSSGSATVAGYDVRDSSLRKKVGVISHHSFLYKDLTAKENLLFYAALYSVKNSEQRAEELLKQVELWDRRDSLAGKFSRGMTQRLSIARALVADPDFVYLDEPFTGLDVHSATMFRNMLEQLHQQGKTIMMISHDIGISLSVATRVAILSAGKLVYESSTENLSIKDFKQTYIEYVGL